MGNRKPFRKLCRENDGPHSGYFVTFNQIGLRSLLSEINVTFQSKLIAISTAPKRATSLLLVSDDKLVLSDSWYHNNTITLMI